MFSAACNRDTGGSRSRKNRSAMRLVPIAVAVRRHYTAKNVVNRRFSYRALTLCWRQKPKLCWITALDAWRNDGESTQTNDCARAKRANGACGAPTVCPPIQSLGGLGPVASINLFPIHGLGRLHMYCRNCSSRRRRCSDLRLYRVIASRNPRTDHEFT